MNVEDSLIELIEMKRIQDLLQGLRQHLAATRCKFCGRRISPTANSFIVYAPKIAKIQVFHGF